MAVKCFRKLPAPEGLLTFSFWIVPVLDGLTDIASTYDNLELCEIRANNESVVSIPIIILRRSQMPLLTKLGLTVFLCL